MSIQAPSRVWELTCPGTPEEVARARRWTRDILHDLPCVDDAVLIVSELVTNAITHTASGHADGRFHIVLARSDTALALSVTDRGGTADVPHINHAPDDAINGRGLQLVSQLALHLETVGDAEGHTTTVAIPMKPADETTGITEQSG